MMDAILNWFIAEAGAGTEAGAEAGAGDFLTT
jgi:hypothetical protein